MENIDKIKCILIDFEIADKTLDESANEILRLFSVVGRSEQLCQCTDSHEFSETYEKEYCRKCDGLV